MTILAADGPRRAKRDRLSSKQRKKSGKLVTSSCKKKSKKCHSICRSCGLRQVHENYVQFNLTSGQSGV
jgi:hypothetical protein